MSALGLLLARLAIPVRPPNAEPTVNEQGVLRREGARVGVHVRQGGRDTGDFVANQGERAIGWTPDDLPEVFSRNSALHVSSVGERGPQGASRVGTQGRADAVQDKAGRTTIGGEGRPFRPGSRDKQGPQQGQPWPVRPPSIARPAGSSRRPRWSCRSKRDGCAHAGQHAVPHAHPTEEGRAAPTRARLTGKPTCQCPARRHRPATGVGARRRRAQKGGKEGPIRLYVRGPPGVPLPCRHPQRWRGKRSPRTCS
eukprot:11178823-Lingulodinium_polyedra.AAC.1